MSVFVSYATADTRHFENLVEHLRALGIEVWSDTDGVQAGGDVRAQLQKGVASCTVAVFVASLASLQSDWCKAEIGAFWGQGKPVIVFRAGVDHAQLPDWLKPDRSTDRLKEVVDAVKQKVGAPRLSSLVKSPGPRIKRQPDAYRELCDRIASAGQIKRAVIIQFANMLATDVVMQLIGHRAEQIDVYVQDEKPDDALPTITRRAQARAELNRQIRNLMRGQRSPLATLLRWHRYQPPAALRAVLIDDDALTVGWYTYRVAAPPTEEGPFDVRGSENPGILCSRGAPEFDMLRSLIVDTAEELERGAKTSLHRIEPSGLLPEL